LSIAALPAPSAIVGVGPALFWSGPRSGLPVLTTSPFAVLMLQVSGPPNTRLLPPETMAPEQFASDAPPLFATMVLNNVIAPVARARPRPLFRALLPATVTLLSVVVAPAA
jgi:hypothetical protein